MLLLNSASAIGLACNINAEQVPIWIILVDITCLIVLTIEVGINITATLKGFPILSSLIADLILLTLCSFSLLATALTNYYLITQTTFIVFQMIRIGIQVSRIYRFAYSASATSAAATANINQYGTSHLHV